MSAIITICSKDLKRLSQGLIDNSENGEINTLSPRIKFKFYKVLYAAIKVRIPEIEVQSASKPDDYDLISD